MIILVYCRREIMLWFGFGEVSSGIKMAKKIPAKEKVTVARSLMFRFTSPQRTGHC